MKIKDTYWEMIKGLCIIAVIIIHSKAGEDYAGTPLAWNFDYWVVERQLVNFAVASFIFLAGYFANIEKIEQDKSSYFGQRVKRLLVPFFIWSTVYSVINMGIDYLSKGYIDWGLYLVNFITGRAGTPFYFIIVLLQLTLIAPVLVKAARGKYLHRLALLITPLYLIFMYFYQYETKTQMPNYEIFFPAWFIFYYLGIVARVHGIQYIRVVRQAGRARLFLAAALVLSIAEAYFMLGRGLTSGAAASQIKISSFIFSYALINVFFAGERISPANNSGLNFLVKIGGYSYGIFFIHCIFRKPMAVLLGYIPAVGSVLPFYHLLQAGGMLMLSVVFIRLSISILSKPRASLWLGF